MSNFDWIDKALGKLAAEHATAEVRTAAGSNDVGSCTAVESQPSVDLLATFGVPRSSRRLEPFQAMLDEAENIKVLDDLIASSKVSASSAARARSEFRRVACSGFRMNCPPPPLHWRTAAMGLLGQT